MDSQVLDLLAAQQNPATLKTGEEQLHALYTNEALPVSLVSIAANTAIDLALRQSALLNLKAYVLKGWSPELDDFQDTVLLSDPTKSQVRDALLELATDDGVARRVQTAASYVVSKIAAADYPEQWPGLLQHLLQIVQSSPSDARLHGALTVLKELADGLEESQFFLIARDLVSALHTVTADTRRSAKIRALAVSVFKGCFDTLHTLIEEHKVEIRAFAEQSLGGWLSLLLDTINLELPPPPPAEANAAEDSPIEAYRGLVALKVQVARVLISIRLIFPAILAPQTPALFSAVWSELTRLQSVFQSTYISSEGEGQLIDADGLPYSLDFLVLENLDFLQGCIRAPPVRKELEMQLASKPLVESWLVELMKLICAYGQIGAEEGEMWMIDVNVFLSEETSVTANYTTRTACGDLAVKVAEWQREKALEALLLHTQQLFSAASTDQQAWRLQEAALYTADQILRDWADYTRTLPPAMCQAFVDIAQSAQQSYEAFLRARALTLLGAVVKASGESLINAAPELFNKNLNAIHRDASDIVQVSAIRAIPAYLAVLPPASTLPLQTPIIQALQQWLAKHEVSTLSESEELLFTMVESLRDVILLDTRVCLTGEGLNLLFSIASSGAENFQMTNLVSETFQEICSTITPLGHDAYAQLTSRVLPSLTGAFDVGSMTEENALMSLSATLLASLSETAPSPLPEGFVSTTLPKLSTVLLQHTDEELLRTCTLSLKHILTKDPTQLLSFASPTTPSKSGLEIVLSVIDRLLSPQIDDNSATEVGGLAAALVEKAGPEKLGQYLLPLLRAVASRVARAESAALIQNLTLVFARLASQNPKDVVDFLAQVQIESLPGTSALQVVMSKWLETVGAFAGYDEIRLNMLALARLYELGDARLANTSVRGDIIVPESGRIVTRSRAKTTPDTYQPASVPVKIVKIFVEELSTSSSDAIAAAAADEAESDDSDADEGEWEDDDTFAGLTGTAKAELLRFADETPGSAAGRQQADGETQALLVQFFQGQGQRDAAAFQAVLAQLNQGERDKLAAVLG